MKAGLLVGLLVAATAQSILAQNQSSFFDNFNRNAGPTTTGSVIGSGYLISTAELAGNAATASWQSATGSPSTLVCSPGALAENVIVNGNIPTLSGLGDGFTVSGDMSGGSSAYMGLAINYQDLNDFYAVRIQPGSSTIELHYVRQTTPSDFLNDQFMRANAGPTTSGSVIGASYVISTPALPGNTGTAPWEIISDALSCAPGTETDNTIVSQKYPTISGGARFGYNLSATMSTPNAGSYMGVVLNYQDSNDFYAIFVQQGTSTVQLIEVKTVSGVTSRTVVASQTLSHTSDTGVVTMPAIALNDVYALSVHSSTPGVFTYTLIDNTTPFTAAGTLRDSSATFSGGYAGLYNSGDSATFLSLSITPLTVVSGTLATATLTTPAGTTLTIATGDTYSLAVTSNAVGSFSYFLTDLTNPACAGGTLADASGVNFRGGVSGLYVTSGAATFYNLAIAAVGNFADNFYRANTATTIVGQTIGSSYRISTPALSGNSGTSSWEIGSNSITAGSFTTGKTYLIESLGTTDFTLIGASSNTVGTIFKATGAGSGTGTASNQQYLVAIPGTNTKNVIISSGVLNLSGSGASFTVSGNLQTSSAGFMGLALNYQDPSDYYAVMIEPGSATIQLVYVKNGVGGVTTGLIASATLITPQSTNLTVATNDNYTLSITSTAIGSFSYVLTDGTSTATGTLTDSSQLFSGGYAGFCVDSGATTILDNLSISSTNSSFDDTYSRADTALTSSGGAIGAGYVVSTPLISGNTGAIASWQIASGQLTITPPSTALSDTLVYMSTAAATSDTTGYGYTVTGTLVPSAGCWLGVTLNFQDANNYYAIRVHTGTTTLQLIDVHQSGSGAFVGLAEGVTLPFSVPSGTDTVLTISSTSAGVFNYTLTCSAGTTSGTLTDSSHRFSGGYAGYYAGSTQQATFGEFSIAAYRSLASPQYLSADPHLQAGVTVMNAYSSPVIAAGNLQWTTANGTPTWTLSEWSNQISLFPGYSPVLQTDGSYRWTIDYTAPSGHYYPLDKAMNLAPAGSSAASSYDMMIEVNSVADYDDTFRTSAQSWPAAYFQEHFGPSGGTLNSAQPTIADLKSLQLSLNAAIPYAYNNTDAGYNPSLHLSHLILFLTVQNLNRFSSGFGDYMWFGIELYNSQKTLTTLVTLVDAGTGKYTYSVGMAPFVAADIGNGGSTAYTTISGDILPLIKQGLQSAWAAGSISGSQNLSDYQIGNYSIGWEVPGLAKVEAAVQNQSLIGSY